MNLRDNPDLIDRLAAQYALGTLRGGARRRLERLARGDAAIATAIEYWRARLQAIGELPAPVPAPESVWHAIERRLGFDRDPHLAHRHTQVMTQGARWFDNLNFWRGWAIAATCAAALALGIALHTPAPTPPVVTEVPQRVAYLSVLADKKAHPALLATWDDSKSTLTVRRVATFPLRAGQTLQLWGLPAAGHPVSLGLVPATAVVTMKMQTPPTTFPTLAVSVEPAGGSPNPQGPTGPVVYTGKMVPAT